MRIFLKAIHLTENILTRTVALLSRQGFSVSRYRFNVPEVWYSPWNEDEKFGVIYSRITKNTIISKRKLFDLYRTGYQVSLHSRGAVLEVGTYRGGSAALFALVFPERPLILWDSWTKALEENTTFIKKSYADTNDLQQAKNLLAEISTDSSANVSFINDIFPNEKTLSSWDFNFSLVHFDIYDAAAFTSGIKLLWPRLDTNGVFIVGGYGAISLDPLTNAVNQFVKENDCFFVQSQSGIGLIFKKSTGM